jgi:hypothetical protein
MSCDPDLLSLARAVLIRNQSSFRDRAWDKPGTEAAILSQATLEPGTEKIAFNQCDNSLVPLSQFLVRGTLGQIPNSGTAPGTDVGQHHGPRVVALLAECPAHIEPERWHQAIRDTDSFLGRWGAQAYALGWTACELFGLHAVPARPAPNYSRLSRYDETGLVWLLHGRPVVALTDATATIRGASGHLVYRKHNKPALGPLGDSLDDMGPCA